MTKTTKAPPAGRQRTGGRSAIVRQKVIDSVLAELVENGYSELSVSKVAKRAEVHETTIYRRWPELEHLVLEACSEVANNIPLPNSGDLRQDLEIVLNGIARLMSSQIGQTLMTLAMAASDKAEFKAPLTKFWHERMYIGQQVLRNAISTLR